MEMQLWNKKAENLPFCDARFYNIYYIHCRDVRVDST